MEQEIFVYIDTPNGTQFVGRLWARMRRGRQTASFEYDRAWLDNPERFSLEPALTLGPGPFHAPSDQPLFGAIGDSAPDRWGRSLMRRVERRRAKAAGETPRTLTELDYLLLVNDEARQGALRFAREQGGAFLATHDDNPIPPLLDLAQLLSAAGRVEADAETEDDLRLLFAPGSSLGGARPKASIRDQEGKLTIAKFPAKDDEIDTVRWEALALTLAAKAGISIPSWRLEDVGGRAVILLERFDRRDGRRIPFLSAMSMLGANDHETRSYLEFVDALRQHGAAPKADMHALWRRIVFTVLISNTDDHLRNHGFLYESPAGWRLAPAYDINPMPTDLEPRILATSIDLDDTNASLDLAYSVADYFELSSDEARAIAAEVGAATSTWRMEAATLGLSRAEINRMASAFEHADLEAAIR